MSHMVGLPQIPFFSMHEYPLNYAISLFILTLITLFIGKDILRNGYKNLIHKTPNMDTLVLIGVTASMLYSIFSTFKIATGNMMYVEKLYFESAAIVIFFIKIGKYVDSTNRIFFKFISGQIIDGIIVGILVTIGMSTIGVKYAVLLGFMIGLFNIIPYFGAIVAVVIASIITIFTGDNNILSALKCVYTFPKA